MRTMLLAILLTVAVAKAQAVTYCGVPGCHVCGGEPTNTTVYTFTAAATVTKCEVDIVVTSSVVTNNMPPAGNWIIGGYLNTLSMSNIIYGGYYNNYDPCADKVREATTYPKVSETSRYVWSNVLTRFMVQDQEIARHETNTFVATIKTTTTITQILATNEQVTMYAPGDVEAP